MTMFETLASPNWAEIDAMPARARPDRNKRFPMDARRTPPDAGEQESE